MSGRGGFTVLEVVVALVLLALGMIPLGGMVALGAATATRARWTAWAVSAAADVADSLAMGGPLSAGSRRAPAGEVRWTAVSARPPEALVEVLPVRPDTPPVRVRVVLPDPATWGGGE